LTQSTLDSSAKPTPIRARLDKFQTVDEFAEGYQQNFLPDGIRLPTRQVKPVGTRIALKLELATGATVLRADGIVESIRENAEGQPIGMDIRFEKIEPNSRRLIERIQAEHSWERQQSGIVPIVHTEDVVTAEGTADFEAIADELDSSFDSIFSAGPFLDAAEAEDTNDTSAIPQYKTLLQRPGALSAALAGADPHDGGTPEWASTLGADFAPASSVEVAPPITSAPEHDAEALLAAFGMNPDAGPPSSSAVMPAAFDENADPDAMPIGRIAFQKLPPQLPSRIAEEDPGRLRSESSTRRPGKSTDTNEATQRAHSSAWAEAPADDNPPSAATFTDDDDLRSMLKQITSDHAAIFDSVHSLSATGVESEAAATPAGDEEDLEALLGVSSSPASQSAPPLPVLPPRLSNEGSAQAADPASSAVDAQSASAVTNGSPPAAAGTALQTSPPQGIVARFVAWLRRLFGAN
jgi:uncharacterized protein (TIGR02266 family)